MDADFNSQAVLVWVRGPVDVRGQDDYVCIWSTWEEVLRMLHRGWEIAIPRPATSLYWLVSSFPETDPADSATQATRDVQRVADVARDAEIS